MPKLNNIKVYGDEFALISGVKDLQETEKIAEKVLCRNVEEIEYDNKNISVS